MGRITNRINKWRADEIPSGTHHANDAYERFAELDGRHEWQTAMPNTFVLYPVRKLEGGRLIYFNFTLAKEMGLIPKSHSHMISKKLERAVLDTFCLRIVNEYDQKQNVRYLPQVMKSHPYMATRYLQLQHPNKLGKTSGDGRSIWNGQISHAGVTWDVSSRGTGVTCLAPGFVEANKPLRSGSTRYGYGCGLADLDELIGAAIFSEIFHKNSVQTERVLAVIDIGGGNGIGVRAAPNLMRPAHIFMHLKQSNYEALRHAMDYFIDREYRNGQIRFSSKHKNRDVLMLKRIVENFARFTAKLDRDYIFAWLDWDGDNVLASSGIIDYGSIRQFGLRHDQYRYDDVERFSTTLNEQKIKAREIIQTFAQAFDFLKYGKKRSFDHFQKHWSPRMFDQELQKSTLTLFLKQIGYDSRQIQFLTDHNLTLVTRFYEAFTVLESTKTRRKTRKVADGINRPAILNMRVALIALADLPQPIALRELFSTMLAKSAKGRDRKPTTKLLRRMSYFQQLYFDLRKKAPDFSAKDFAQNAKLVNRPDRITGDALLYIVDEIIVRMRKQKITVADVQRSIDSLVAEQSPPKRNSQYPEKSHQLQTVFARIIDGHRECI